MVRVRGKGANSSNGPQILWLYPVFGIRGASWFLGCSEWLFGELLFLGFWNKRLGIFGAIGSTATFIMTVTIVPFMPNGWDPVAGFPAMADNVPFLMKDIVLLAVSIYLLKRRDTHYEGRNLRSKSGSLAKFAAMRRASPPVSRLVADRRPGSFFKMNVCPALLGRAG
jgi:hypothetical protein